MIIKILQSLKNGYYLELQANVNARNDTKPS